MLFLIFQHSQRICHDQCRCDPLAVGQWVTAALVVVFMRIGDYVENFTTESARRAVKELTTLAPQTARVERDGAEIEIPVREVKLGETVIVRPGEKIAVDGEVINRQATIDQSAITGESMPTEAASGTQVYAATIAKLGSLRVRAERIGVETTFGRVDKMVEEAEAHRRVKRSCSWKAIINWWACLPPRIHCALKSQPR